MSPQVAPGRRTLWALAAAGVVLWPAAAAAYQTNGRSWPEMPVRFAVNVASAPAELGDAAEAVALLATEAWGAVGCSYAAFEYLGPTEATWAADGQNTIFWVTDDWLFQEGAAGASLTLPTEPGELPEVDLALNAADFRWVPGGADALQADVLEPAAVITHELGHWLGLAHSNDPFATMYLAYIPDGGQATLAADDKAGLCHLYPEPDGTQECDGDADCPDGQLCEAIEAFRVCAEQRAPVGSPCSRYDLNCVEMCFLDFTSCSTLCWPAAEDYSEGYCANICHEQAECLPGWTCTDVEDLEPHVCLRDDLPPDAGVVADAGLPADAAGPVPDGATDAAGPVPDAASAAPDGPPDAAPDAPPADAAVAPLDAPAPTTGDTLPPETDDAAVSAGDATAAGTEGDAGGCSCRAAPSSPEGASFGLLGLLSLPALRRRARGAVPVLNAQPGHPPGRMTDHARPAPASPGTPRRASPPRGGPGRLHRSGIHRLDAR